MKDFKNKVNHNLLFSKTAFTTQLLGTMAVKMDADTALCYYNRPEIPLCYSLSPSFLSGPDTCVSEVELMDKIENSS